MNLFIPATCYPNDCFCESLKQGVLMQPVNAISSLAYVFAGLWLLLKYPKLRKMPYAFFAFVFVLIGLSSFYYHAKFNLLGQVLDVGTMFLFVFGMILIWHKRSVRQGNILLLYGVLAILVGVSVAVLVYFPLYRRILWGSVLLGVVFLEIRYQFAKRGSLNSYFKQGLIILLIGALMWVLDRYRIICFPDSILQLHSIWHIATAIAGYFLVLYYVEKV